MNATSPALADRFRNLVLDLDEEIDRLLVLRATVVEAFGEPEVVKPPAAVPQSPRPRQQTARPPGAGTVVDRVALLLSQNGPMSQAAIAKSLGINPNSVKLPLQKPLFERVGTDRLAPYQLSAAGRALYVNPGPPAEPVPKEG